MAHWAPFIDETSKIEVKRAEQLLSDDQRQLLALQRQAMRSCGFQQTYLFLLVRTQVSSKRHFFLEEDFIFPLKTNTSPENRWLVQMLHFLLKGSLASWQVLLLLVSGRIAG